MQKMIVRAAVMTIDGTLDLDASLTTNVDTVIKSIDNSVAVTLALTADSDYDHGHLDESAYPAIVYHYKSGVTTVANFEAAITDSQHLVVVTPGTGANILLVTADDFTATTLATGTMNTSTDQCIVDVSDLTNVSVFLNQLVDSGTVTIVLEKSIDGVNWALIDASTVATDFVAGNNTSLEFTLSDSNGMPTLCKQVRATCTAYGASGTYSMTVSGLLNI